MGFLSLAQELPAETCTEYPGSSASGFDPVNAVRHHAIVTRDNFAFASIEYSDFHVNSAFFSLELGEHNSIPPVVRDFVGLPGPSGRTVIIADTAVMAMGSVGLCMVDIVDPDSLPYAVVSATGDVCRDLALSGPRHIVTAEWSALRIYDLQDPLAPVFLSEVPLSQARAVAVEGNLAFVACGALGLAVVDISDPSDPFLVTQFPVGGSVTRVATEGNRVYLTGYLIGLATVDVADPLSPVLVATLPLLGEAGAIEIRDGYGYVLVVEAIPEYPPDPSDAMALIRLNNPGVPELVDYLHTSQGYSSLSLGDDRIFLGEGHDGSKVDLVLARLMCPDVSPVPDLSPRDLILSAPWPNPFNPRVQLGFRLAEGLTGRLRVHDLRGNLVADIWEGVGTGREIRVEWNGTDQAGRACPSGTYGFLLSDGNGRQTTRVTGTLLR